MVRIFNEGFKLEFRIKRLLFFMGYFPVQDILIKTNTDSSSISVTDLDVLGIKYSIDYRRQTLWADCKSGKINTMDRLNWITGVRDTNSFDNVLFVNQVKRETFFYASKLNINLLDRKQLDIIEQNYKINPNLWLGSWNYEIMLNIEEKFRKESIPGIENSKIANLLMSDYWIYDPYTGFKKLITALRQLAKVPYITEKNSPIKWAIFQAVLLITDSILRIIQDVFYLSKTDREDYIRQRIVAGDMPLEKRNEIFRSAINYISVLLRDQGYSKQLNDNINIIPPSYTNDLIDVVERFITNLDIGKDILRTMDFCLMQFDLANNDYDADLIKTMLPEYEKNRAGMKLIYFFVCDKFELPRDYFRLINHKL